jgi:hypothetical protein
MCGAPLSKAASQETSTASARIAAALMAISHDMINLIFNWWSTASPAQEEAASGENHCLAMSCHKLVLNRCDEGVQQTPYKFHNLVESVPSVLREYTCSHCCASHLQLLGRSPQPTALSYAHINSYCVHLAGQRHTY